MTDTTNETQVEVTLKPCPFCGGDPLIGQTLDHAWFAMCERDFCAKLEAYWRTEAEAITAWNMRIQAEKHNNALAVELREARVASILEARDMKPQHDPWTRPDYREIARDILTALEGDE